MFVFASTENMFHIAYKGQHITYFDFLGSPRIRMFFEEGEEKGMRYRFFYNVALLVHSKVSKAKKVTA